MTDLNAKVRTIIETAIADLVALGMNHDDALHLLAFQCTLRMGNPSHLACIAEEAQTRLALYTTEDGETVH